MRIRTISVAVALTAVAIYTYGQEQGKGDVTRQENAIVSSLSQQSVALTNIQDTLEKKLIPWLATYNRIVTNSVGKVTSSVDDAMRSFSSISQGFKQGESTFASATNSMAQCLEILQAIKGKLDESIAPSSTSNDDVSSENSALAGKKIREPAVWIASGAAILAAILALVAVIVSKNGASSIERIMEDEAHKRKDEADKTQEKVEQFLKKAFEDADAVLKKQVVAAKTSISAIDGKVSALDRALREQPAKLDAVIKTFSREAESQRQSIMGALFGHARASTETPGLAPQMEMRLGALEKTVLSAVTTEHELQLRKVALDIREKELSEREQNFSAELDEARKEGASSGMKKVAALETAGESLRKVFEEMQTRFSAKLSEQSQDFGKRIATLEAERDGAVLASRKAENTAADANRRVAAAEESNKKLKAERDAAIADRIAEVKRLGEEIRRRDETRDAEIAKARDNIRAEIEKANADAMAQLQADVQSARDERAKAEDIARRAAEDSAKTIESLRLTCAKVDSELAVARTALEAEKSARAAECTEAERVLAAEKSAAAQILAAEKAAHDTDLQKAGREVAELVSARDAARSRLFPAEFASAPELKTLLESLDGMDAKSLPGAALARASLAIIADRRNLPDKIWLRAVGDFSLGLAKALEANGATDSMATLANWKTVLEKFGSNAPSFSLRLPAIGSKVDIAWMHSRAGVSTVRKVRSWAVFGSKGNAYMAEVE